MILSLKRKLIELYGIQNMEIGTGSKVHVNLAGTCQISFKKNLRYLLTFTSILDLFRNLKKI